MPSRRRCSPNCRGPKASTGAVRGSTPHGSPRRKGGQDREAPDRPRKARQQAASRHRPEGHPAHANAHGGDRQRGERRRAGSRQPPTRPGQGGTSPAPARHAARRQGRRLAGGARDAPRSWHHAAYRASWDRIEGATGPASVGSDWASIGGWGRVPSPGSTSCAASSSATNAGQRSLRRSSPSAPSSSRSISFHSSVRRS